MALTQINALTSGNASTASAASKTTGSFTATTGRALLAAIMFRSQDVADLSAETFQVTSSAGGSQSGAAISPVFYDVSTRCGMAAFLITGASGSGTLTFSLVSGRLTGRQGWMVTELQDGTTGAVVQAGHTSGASPLSVSLSSFASGSNFAVIFAFADGNGHLFTKEAGYTELINTTGGNGPDSYAAEYLGASDTTPSVTYAGGGTACAAIGIEMQGAAAAVTDQPDKTGMPRGLRRGIARGIVHSMNKINGLWRPAQTGLTPSVAF